MIMRANMNFLCTCWLYYRVVVRLQVLRPCHTSKTEGGNNIFYERKKKGQAEI